MPAPRYKDFSGNATRDLISQTEKLHGSVAYYEVDIDSSKVGRTWNEFKAFTNRVPYVKTEEYEGYLVADANDDYLHSVLMPIDAMRSEPVFIENRTELADKQRAKEEAAADNQKKVELRKIEIKKREEKINDKLISKMEQINAYLGPVFDVDLLSEKLKVGSTADRMILEWSVPREHHRLMTAINQIEKADGDLNRISEVRGDKDKTWKENVDEVAKQLTGCELLARFGYQVEISQLRDGRYKLALENEAGVSLASANLDPVVETLDHLGFEGSKVVLFHEEDMTTFQHGKEVQPGSSVLLDLVKALSQKAYLTEDSDPDYDNLGEYEEMRIVDSDEMTSAGIQAVLLSDVAEADRISRWVSEQPKAPAKKKVLAGLEP